MARFDFIEKRKSEIPKETKVFVSKTFDILERISEIMKEKGITQKELAIKLNKKQSEISKWINGTQNFTILTLSKLEVALGEELLTIPCKRNLARKKYIDTVFHANQSFYYADQTQIKSLAFQRESKVAEKKSWGYLKVAENMSVPSSPRSITVKYAGCTVRFPDISMIKDFGNTDNVYKSNELVVEGN